MRSLLVVPTLALVMAASISAGSAKEGSDEAAALRALDKKWADAFMKEDVNGVAAYYADDAVVMDPGPALLVRGKEEIRKSFGSFFSGVDAISFSVGDATYRTVGSLGYGYGTFEISYKDKKTGKTMSMKGRALTVFEKRGGKWVAVADHASFPMPAKPPAEAAAPAAGE